MKQLTEEDKKNIGFALAVLNRPEDTVISRGEKWKLKLAMDIAKTFGLTTDEDGKWISPLTTL